MASNASRLVLDGFYDTILVRFVGEIGIKSEKVRRRLIDRLAACIGNQLERKRVRGFLLSITHARLFLAIKDPGGVAAVHELLQRIPGIHSFSYCSVFPLDPGKVHDRAVALARLLLKEGRSFAVRVTREGTHEFTSQALARDVGSSILENLKDTRPRVDLTRPDITIYIEVRDSTALIYHEKHDGFGGMPRDVSSPVLGSVGLASTSWEACHRVIKRGSNLHPVLLRPLKAPAMSIHDPAGAADFSSLLNEDPEIVGKMFQLLDVQEDNRVRVTVVPIPSELLEWIEHELIPVDSEAIATFLGIVVPALVHARVHSGSTRTRRKAMDFKAIVSDYAGRHAGGSTGALRWIQAASTAVEAMMPAGVPALPIIFPLMPGGTIDADQEAITAGEAVPSCADGTLLELLGRPATREELLALLQHAVDQRRAVQFDMIERRFVSRE
nr:THUMP domain-containing protein [Candidatus Sigynarchaeum springense]